MASPPAPDWRPKVQKIWVEEMARLPAWSLLIRHRNLELDLHSTLMFSGASMIKTFILEVVSRQVVAGTLQWDTPVEVNTEHQASGDGVIRDWLLPQTLPLHTVAHLMITISDNTATNAIVDHLGGLRLLNDYFRERGYQSRLRGWVGGADLDPRRGYWTSSPQVPSPAGLSIVMPREHAKVIRALATKPKYAIACRILLAQQDNRSLARYLHPGTPFAHKTGTVHGLRHDGGVLLPGSPDQVEIQCFTDGDSRWENTDDPACVAMGNAFAKTLIELGLTQHLCRSCAGSLSSPAARKTKPKTV